MNKAIFLSLLCFWISNAFGYDKVMTLSDIHFDPFSNCKGISRQVCPLIHELQLKDYREWEQVFNHYSNPTLPLYHQNTNFSLLKSMLKAIGNTQKKDNPRFVLVLGDVFGHNFKSHYAKFSGDYTQEGYERFVSKTMQFLILEIKQQMPQTNVYLAVGNNDSYTDDYGVVPNGKFFSETSQHWQSLIHDKLSRTEFLKAFKIGGYYSTRIPHTHHRLIVLNSALFSTWANTSQSITQAAQQELNWLDRQLTAAEQHHERVLLAMHIPVGIDVFQTIHSFYQPKIFWVDRYAIQFRNILSHHKFIIAGIMQSHIHKDAFQILTLDKTIDVLVMKIPSISPIYGNNPGFDIYEYDHATFQFKNVTVYYLPLPAKNNQWLKEYDFSHLYQPVCQACTLLKKYQQLLSNQVLFNDFYQKYYRVSASVDALADGDMKYYRCGVTEFSIQDYKTCLETTIPAKNAGMV